MGEMLEVAKVLVEPTMKLMDMVGDAIGTAYEPRRKRKMADATAYEISVVGDAMRNAADMPVVYNQDGVAINSEDFARLMQRAGTRLVLQETIKQHNIESVIDHAYDILEEEDVCSEEPVEQGWRNRFFDSVADVSDEDLQILWGKILAGEVKQPNSYSLRTLETLKNLSKEEAELFEKIAPLVVRYGNNLFLTSETNILKKYGVSYDTILRLDECGLINSDGMVSYNPTLSTDDSLGLFNKSKLMIIKGLSQSPRRTSFGIFGLTRAGKELYSILDCESNDEYICDFAEKIEKSNKGHVCITIHQIHNYDIENLSYDATVLKEFPPKNEEE